MEGNRKPVGFFWHRATLCKAGWPWTCALPGSTLHWGPSHLSLGSFSLYWFRKISPWVTSTIIQLTTVLSWSYPSLKCTRTRFEANHRAEGSHPCLLGLGMIIIYNDSNFVGITTGYSQAKPPKWLLLCFGSFIFREKVDLGWGLADQPLEPEFSLCPWKS